MKTKEEIKQWILNNCVDNGGDIDLRGLDFSDFGGDIYASRWEVKKDLHQSGQKVNGDLYQIAQEVKGSLFQNRQTVGGELVQDKQQKTKKVFSTALWVKDALSAGLRNEKRSSFSWVNDCAGKTKEECKAMGYLVIDAWFEEVEVKE